MMDKLEREYAVGLGILVLVIAVFVIALALWAGKSWERTAEQFQAACVEARGTAVWNGKYWECLR